MVFVHTCSNPSLVFWYYFCSVIAFMGVTLHHSFLVVMGASAQDPTFGDA